MRGRRNQTIMAYRGEPGTGALENPVTVPARADRDDRDPTVPGDELRVTARREGARRRCGTAPERSGRLFQKEVIQ